MGIWVYRDHIRDIEAIRTAIELTRCLFCNTRLKTPIRDVSRSDWVKTSILATSSERIVRFCPVCGWWTTKESYAQDTLTHCTSEHVTRVRGAAASLMELDLSDQALPLQEIRDYLSAKYDSRFEVHPKSFEEVVASVYRDLGYSVTVTGRTGDGGIDVILEGPRDSSVGVQVKRTVNSIRVEQIRSLVGALVLKGLTRGVFVTTSRFQRGAGRTSAQAQMRGIPVELIDAKRFYHVLKIAQRRHYETATDPGAPFSITDLQVIEDSNISEGI